MSKWTRLIGRLVVVGFFFLMLDGCLRGDPWVRLAHGYEIVAISWESPCSLRSTFDVDEVSGITGFDRRGELVIGNCDAGFFILDMAENSVGTFVSEDEWARSVEARTGRPPSGLTDPKSAFVQRRQPPIPGILGVLTCCKTSR